MTSTRKFLLSLALVALLFSCSRKEKRMALEEKIAAEAPPAEPAAIHPDYHPTGITQEEMNQGLTAGTYANATGGIAPITYNWTAANGAANTLKTGGAGAPASGAQVAPVVSSTAAVENKSDTTRKFIRTADLRFRVKDVVQATYTLEDIAAKFDGYVTYTNLFSTIRNKTTVPISADSSLETIYFTMQNTMTIRVPNTKLDSTLRAIAPVIDFLDHRTVHANDVRLTLLENKLRKDRSERYSARLAKAVEEKGRRLSETSHAEDKILAKEEQADEALISNLRLADQIEFSTIQVLVYQRETFRRELVPNDKNIKAYGPGLLSRTGDALKNGWSQLEGIFLFFVKSWGVWLILAIILIVGYRLVFLRKRDGDY